MKLVLYDGTSLEGTVMKKNVGNNGGEGGVWNLRGEVTVLDDQGISQVIDLLSVDEVE